jgi:hypothetical protein
MKAAKPRGPSLLEMVLATSILGFYFTTTARLKTTGIEGTTLMPST